MRGISWLDVEHTSFSRKTQFRGIIQSVSQLYSYVLNSVCIWTFDNSLNICIFTVAVRMTQRVARFISPDLVRAPVPNHAVHFIRCTCLHLAARSWAASTPQSLLTPSFLPIYFVLHNDAAVRVTSAPCTGHWRRFCGIRNI